MTTLLLERDSLVGDKELGLDFDESRTEYVEDFTQEDDSPEQHTDTEIQQSTTNNETQFVIDPQTFAITRDSGFSSTQALPKLQAITSTENLTTSNTQISPTNKQKEVDVKNASTEYAQVLQEIHKECETLKRVTELWIKNISFENSKILTRSINTATQSLFIKHQNTAEKIADILEGCNIDAENFRRFAHEIKSKIIGLDAAVSGFERCENLEATLNYANFLLDFISNSMDLELLRQATEDDVEAIFNGNFIDSTGSIDDTFGAIFSKAFELYRHDVDFILSTRKKVSYKQDVADNLAELPKSIWIAVDQFVRNSIDSIAEKREAIKSRQNQGEDVKLKNGKVKLKIKNRNKKGEWVISVTDNGLGMSKETIRKIIMHKSSTKEKIGGGEGLTNAFNVCESLGGYCLITSQEGVGTQIKLVIPKNIENAKKFLIKTA